jgi:glycosyltransferase involved in cell wall biosynthesis
MGRKALEHVHACYVAKAGAQNTLDKWRELFRGNKRWAKKMSVAFVLPAVIGRTSGGCKVLFYLAQHLAKRGHTVDVYVDPSAHLAGMNSDQMTTYCEEHFGRSRVRIHSGHTNITPSDVAIATAWSTAHVVSQNASARFKAYFVQDYEPNFYQPTDPSYAHAESTYDFQLQIITIGKYLAQLLTERNKISYTHVDFALNDAFLAKNPNLSRHRDSHRKLSIMFFARPSIPRRNFPCGVEALAKLHELKPDVEIKLYGLEEPVKLPFPYTNLGVLSQHALADALRTSDVHLSFSMTNVGTAIYEAMACGCVPVEVNVPSVRVMVDDGKNCLLADPNPDSVCEKLVALIANPSLRQSLAINGYKSVKNMTVQNMCRQFESTLQHFLFLRSNSWSRA